MFASRRIFNLVLALAIVGLGAAGYVAIGPPAAAKAVTSSASVAKGSVLSSVSATGNASAATQLSLTFQTSGVVTEIDVSPGQRVTAGQVLAKVSNTTQQDALKGAQAALTSAEAKLAQDQQVETPQQRAVDQAASDLAQQSVNSAVANVGNAQASAAQDAVNQAQTFNQTQQGVANAQATAQDDAKLQAAAVQQAKDNVSGAQAGAAQDVITQQTNVSQAQQSVSNAQANASQDATTQQANVNSAQQRQTDDNNANATKRQQDLQAQQTAQQTYAADNCGTAQAAPACPSDTQNLNNANAAVAADRSQQDQDAQAVAAAQNTQQASALKDQQTIQAAQNALTNSQNAQQASALKDQQTIQAAQNALTNSQNSQEAGSVKDQQAIQAAQNALTSSQNNLTAAQLKDAQALQTAQQQLASAEASQASTAANNAVKEVLSPATIAADQGSADTAQTQLDTAQQNYNQTILTAPVAGTVAAINGTVGVLASGGSSSSGSGGSGAGASSSSSSSSGFITLTDLQSLQVVAGFSETDAVKIQVGQAATVTFNALPSQNLQAKVTQIDLTSQVVSNVVTYNVTVSILNPPPTLKPGMTANLSVTTAERDNVITLPSSAVSSPGSTATMQVQGPTGKPVARTVTIGLRGDTVDEITSGLNVGDKVVLTRSSSTGSAGTARLPTGGGLGGLVGGGGAGGGGGFGRGGG